MADISDFLVAGPNTPFLVAGCVLVAICTIELVGLIAGHSFLHHDGDIDFTIDANGNGIPDYLEAGHGDFFGWINPGHLPSMVFLIIFCGIYAILGFTAQWLYDSVFGHLAPALLAGPSMFALTLPCVSALSIPISRALPKDESNAVDVDSLIGSDGVVIAGPVGHDDFGMARFTDQYGTDHSIMVSSESDENIATGSRVVLLRPHRDRTIAFVVRKI